jgi:predicted amidohydrolase
MGMAVVRIGLCQFGLRDTRSYEEFEEHFSQETMKAASRGAEILLFPELVTWGLVAMAGRDLTYSQLGDAVAQHLGPFTPRFEVLLTKLAQENGVIIAAGSHWAPAEEEGKGYNTAYLAYPEGRLERQRKNHLYPSETDYGTITYDGLEVYDTPKARIGLVTCYEVEFPEVARHFMLKGVQILLCPSATYTIRGFYRVRHCCAARAVENQLYVAQCHQAGALSVPVDKPTTAYGRSVIFGPIDDQTNLSDGVVVEAPNPEQETVVVGDVDLDLLERSRTVSEATLLKDRRPETYKKYYQIL